MWKRESRGGCLLLCASPGSCWAGAFCSSAWPGKWGRGRSDHPWPRASASCSDCEDAWSSSWLAQWTTPPRGRWPRSCKRSGWFTRVPRSHIAAWPLQALLDSVSVGLPLVSHARIPGYRTCASLWGFCIVLFLWAFPQSLTLRTLDLWFSFMMALVVLWVSPLASGVEASSSLLPFGATLVLCLFSMNFRLNVTCLWSVSLSICSTIYFGTESFVEEFLPDRTQRVTQVLVANCIFSILLTIVHQSVYLVVQYDMEANISRNELKAARSVLRGVCDAVVELDSDFRLQDGSSELVGMLLLNPLRPILGEDFRQFLASRHNREKFSEQISKVLLPIEDSVGLSPEDSVGLSAAFHVSMKDSSSVTLEVEMFCVRFVNREGQTAHFIGIREFTDTAPMLRGSVSERTRRDERASGPQSSCTALVRLPAAPADSTAEASGQASTDVSPEASSLDEKWEDLGAEAEPVAWVDLLTPTYEVRLETFAFTKYVDAQGGLLSAVRP
ncbi:unnamed protein product [Prorocentrum cordatum]|uniref:Uncharacterized protein n=1 Tax=Prorocentrum cordatum TaxID=2364126 RepID=A0ABN9SGF6_9DINO|nr:unnamed protein product [Polarella glacialis]